MRLSTFTDYSLRVLIYLGLQGERLSTIAEIAERFGISQAHLMKVVHGLARSGYVRTVRGKGGGMELALAPRDIRLGQVIRSTEADFDLVECFDDTSACRIQSACALKAILGEGLEAMFETFDRYTLEDLLKKPKALLRAITVRAA